MTGSHAVSRVMGVGLACLLALSGAATPNAQAQSNSVTYDSTSTSASDDKTDSLCCGGRPTTLESKVTHEAHQHQTWTLQPGSEVDLSVGIAQYQATFSATWTEKKTTITTTTGWAACGDHSIRPATSTETDTLEVTATQSGTATLIVQHVILDPTATAGESGATYSVRASTPDQPGSGTSTVHAHTDATDPCGSGVRPPPDRTQTAPVSPGGVPVNLSNVQGDPGNGNQLTGTQTQSLPWEHGTTTITVGWDVPPPGTLAAGCDALQATVDAETARIDADNAGITSVLNQMSVLATTVAGQSPELAPLATDLANAIAQVMANEADSATFDASVAAWAQGDGAQQIAALESQMGLSPTAGPLVANMVPLLQSAQSLSQTAVHDAEQLAAAQANLAACQS